MYLILNVKISAYYIIKPLNNLFYLVIKVDFRMTIFVLRLRMELIHKLYKSKVYLIKQNLYNTSLHISYNDTMNHHTIFIFFGSIIYI